MKIPKLIFSFLLGITLFTLSFVVIQLYIRLTSSNIEETSSLSASESVSSPQLGLITFSLFLLATLFIYLIKKPEKNS